MKSKFLIIAWSIFTEISFGQSTSPLKAFYYDAEGKRYFSVSGSTPETEVSFHAERGGGVLLQTNNTDANGKVSFITNTKFLPAFVLNNSKANSSGTKGSGFICLIGGKEFNLNDIELKQQNEEGKVSIHWKAAFRNKEDYTMEILKSVDGINYIIAKEVSPTQNEEYNYVHSERVELSENVVYKIRITKKGSDFFYNSNPVFLKSIASIKAYPNLTTSNLNVQLKAAGNTKMVSYYITNSSGQIIQSGSIEHLDLISLSVSALQSGSYLITIQTDKTEKLSQAFIKL